MQETARGLISSAFRLVRIYAPGDPIPNDDMIDAFTWLNRMVDRWKTQRLIIQQTRRNVHSLVANQQRYTVGPGGDFDQVRPLWIPYVGLILDNLTPPNETPLEILTVKDWALEGVKTQASTQPTRVYVDWAYPTTGAEAGMLALEFWPVPQIAYDVAIYTPTPLETFAALDTVYNLAPGYADAIEYSLAERLCEPFGRECPPKIERNAATYVADIKRTNSHLVELSIDPALRARGGRYNWRTDRVS